MKEQEFTESIKLVKIPILILDQKWHRLFALEGKPEEVKNLEEKLTDLLAHQGDINQEYKELKKLKQSLMKNIMDNMEGAEASSDAEKSKNLEESKRLIDDVNKKISDIEDELLEIPKQIKENNDALMMETMNFCYSRLRTNYKEAEEISTWIKDVRVELKKNLIRKQNREINNREIYAYMHDIFGKDVVNLFDVENQDIDLVVSDQPADSENTSSEQSNTEEHKD